MLENEDVERRMNQGGEGSSLLLLAALKGAKGKSNGKGTGPNGGKGLCWNRGKVCHVADKRPDPPNGNRARNGGKHGKDDGNWGGGTEVNVK